MRSSWIGGSAFHASSITSSGGASLRSTAAHSRWYQATSASGRSGGDLVSATIARRASRRNRPSLVGVKNSASLDVEVRAQRAIAISPLLPAGTVVIPSPRGLAHSATPNAITASAALVGRARRDGTASAASTTDRKSVV